MDETFSAYHRVLSIIGVPFFAKKNWNSKPWLLLQIFNIIIGLISFVFTSVFVVNSFSNMLVFIECACVWTTGVTATICLLVCFFFRSDFRNFLNEMAFKDTMLEMPLIQLVLKMNKGNNHLMELKNLVEESQMKLLKYSKLGLMSYVGMACTCATLYISSAIYVMISKYDGSMRLLAFDMWFPWSLQDLRVYVASFIFHVYCAWLCCIAVPGLQSTILLLTGQLIRQLRILGFILMHLNELAKEITVNEPQRWQECCTAVLTQCLKHYIELKKFSNKLNEICRPFYLTLIMITIFLVGMCSVKITISNKLSPDTMKYYVHGFCFICVELMFCLLGQQVLNECAFLEKAVAEKWYIYDKKHKKNVIIFFMAVSQGMPIYIFGSITLSLPTFTWFIRTGMSFFTLLMSVLEEAE